MSEVTLSFHMLARLFKGKSVNVNGVIIKPNPIMLNEAENAEQECEECDKLLPKQKIVKIPCGRTLPQVIPPYTTYEVCNYSKCLSQPKYREPTAEDVGRGIEVHIGGETWGDAYLLAVLPETIFGDFVGGGVIHTWFDAPWKYSKKARIKVEKCDAD